LFKLHFFNIFNKTWWFAFI